MHYRLSLLRQVMLRSEIYKEEVWRSVFKKELGDPNVDETTLSANFVFIICTTDDYGQSIGSRRGQAGG